MQELEHIGRELPRVARAAIREYLAAGPRPEGDAPTGGVLRAPVFVTLRNADGSLRGCVGSISATEPDVVRETARSAVLAATRDPRFPPVSEIELASLGVEVSVLLPEEPITGLEHLDPKRYGVIVRGSGGRQGLLLPEIAGIDDAATQVAIASKKAGIAPGEGVSLSRFAVHKWREEPAGPG